MSTLLMHQLTFRTIFSARGNKIQSLAQFNLIIMGDIGALKTCHLLTNEYRHKNKETYHQMIRLFYRTNVPFSHFLYSFFFFFIFKQGTPGVHKDLTTGPTFGDMGL